jgi:octaprenyl-diphosphate synthase
MPSFELICSELGLVKKLMDEQLAVGCERAMTGRLVESFNRHSGKMLRPGLLLLAGAACGQITEKHIRTAAIVEMIHNATLLHDDVIDDGQRRRGQPTVNSLWGNESAVLLGDFLLSRVFRMCADFEPQVTEAIAVAAGRTCEGELRQVAQRRNWQLSETDYIDIITDKSAELFSCSCLLGGLLSGADQTKVRCLADFGRNVGIAFQIMDDLLDITGAESGAGKTLGSDVAKNNPTLAVIHLLGAVEDSEKSTIRKMLSAGCDGRRTLSDKLRSHGSLQYADDLARVFVAKAVSSLAEFEDSDAKQALVDTAAFVGRRSI